jgi:hypothetical protein
MFAFHIVPSVNSCTAYAEALAVKAIYVSDGFWQADEVIAEPSVTKRFDTSWV